MERARVGRLSVVAGLLLALTAQVLSPPRAGAQLITCNPDIQFRSSVSTSGRFGFGPPSVQYLTSTHDGVAIEVGLIRPRVPPGTRVPVIVQASPYNPPLRPEDVRACAAFLTENFVPHGYAVALVSVRGSGGGGGCFDLFGRRERGDLDRAVTWLATRPWSNGAVGMIGLSYDGATAWEVAASGNEHLKTIVPISGVPDVFDLLFGSGTPDWRAPGALTGVYFGTSILLPAPGRAPDRTVEVVACPDYAVAQGASLHSSATGELDPFGYWAERRYVDRILQRYRGSIFWVHGLQDWNVNPGSQFPLVTDLRRRGVPMKMLMGQWGHAYPDGAAPQHARRDFADVLLGWFDRWLKGQRVDTGAAVEVEDSSGRWRTERTWPPPGRKDALALSDGGALTVPAAARRGSAVLAPDPFHLQDPASAQGAGVSEVPIPDAVRGLCAQPVCASFRSAPATGAYRLSGIPSLRLRAAPLGPGGSISAFLFAEGTGELRRIGWGQVDLRFPTGRGRPRPVVPGEAITLDFPLQPFDAVVRRGESLVLMLSVGNTYNRLPSLTPAPVILELGGATGALTVTRISPARSQFFRPPAPD